ncbi:hypothetical protein PUV47_04875 [Pseudovibrio exalbescens]|uniref:hypothetical protein n=1 Tax=Pseudovibrio exalbescens TaxID=197461 RepID=UPI0023650CFD|nr:hypothetical protein [Pseudovibrio exalbescens]MDD7909241.1 hypothetical protein [Pseudovibrio exalbescens]
MPKLRYIILGTTTLIIGGLVTLSLTGTSAISEEIDASQASSLALVGDSIAVAITTKDDDHKSVEVHTNDYKWCDLSAKLSSEGDRVVVRMERSAWSRFGWCDPEAEIAIPSAFNLDVELDAIAANLTGSYEAVRIKADRGVLRFNGTASTFDLVADAAVVYLNFLSHMALGSVNIDVDKIVSSISYPD